LKSHKGATATTLVFPHPALLGVTKKGPLPYGGTAELRKNTNYHFNEGQRIIATENLSK